jgi:WD40 repeat protein
LDDVRPDYVAFDPAGLRLAKRGPNPDHRLWSLAAPAGADPIVLRRGPSQYAHLPEFSPDGQWLATNDWNGLTMWPLVRRYPAVIGVNLEAWSHGVAFAPDGSFLATFADNREVRVWPLAGPVPPAGHVVFKVGDGSPDDLAVSPDGEHLAVGVSRPRGVRLGSEGEEPLVLAATEGLAPGTNMLSFSPDGRLLAALVGYYDPASAAFHVWEVATGEEIAVLRLEGEEFTRGPGFASDGRLLTGSTKGVMAWDVETGEREVLVDLRLRGAVASNDGRRLLLVTEEGEVGVWRQDPTGSTLFFDLDTGEVTALTTHGSHVRGVATDQDGTVAVTADVDGVIRVGPVTGEEPHLLLGHDGVVLDLRVDPLGRWIASGGMDKTVRLWPMPDLSKPPLHTLPHDELIAKLKTLTNLRVVRDEESSTGWTLTPDPFPGWETAPTW